MTSQNTEPLSTLITSQLNSPNPEGESFERPAPIVESSGVKSIQFKLNCYSSQTTDQNYNSGLFRNSSSIPTQIDNDLADDAN